MNNPAQTLGAILLAAGCSSRLGRPKQLVELDGEALVRRQARILLSIEPACVVVVTGCEASGVAQALSGVPVQCVHNAKWQDGMGTSLATGVRAIPERVRGALLLLCDQWQVDANDLRLLLDGWATQPQSAALAQWSAATSGVASGPPAIFPRQMFARLSRLEGRQGARQVLKHFKGGLLRVDLPHAAFDLDTPADGPSPGSNLPHRI